MLKIIINGLSLLLLITALLLDQQPGLSRPPERLQLSSHRLQIPLQSINSTRFLPIVYRRLPPTLFGAEMAEISPQGGLEQMKQAGLYWTRRNSVWWPDVEPVKGERDWSVLAELEKEMLNAVNANQELILIVRGTPEWAQLIDGSLCGPIKEEEFSSFASFMGELVTRYSGSPYFVKYWEILNEPDAHISHFDEPFGCWGDVNDEYYGGGYYAEMLKLIYPEMKAANPDVQVVLGGLLLDCDPENPPEDPPGSGLPKDCSSAKFLEGVLLNGGGDYFDILGYHAYDYYQGEWGQYSNANWNSAWNTTGPGLIAKTNFVQSVMSEHGYSGKPIMNTEVALLCYSDCNGIFEATKAIYLAQVYTIATGLGLQANIWYDVYGYWRDSGLIYSDGTPRTAYDALQTSRRMIGNTVYNRPISDQQGVTGYEFFKGERRIWVLWSQDGGVHSVTLSSMPDAMWDTLGEAISPSSSFILDISPVYIVWDY